MLHFLSSNDLFRLISFQSSNMLSVLSNHTGLPLVPNMTCFLLSWTLRAYHCPLMEQGYGSTLSPVVGRCSPFTLQLKCSPRETPLTMPPELGPHGHSLWSILVHCKWVTDMACYGSASGCWLLQVPARAISSTYLSCAERIFCVYPGGEKLAIAAYITMLTSSKSLATA